MSSDDDEDVYLSEVHMGTGSGETSGVTRFLVLAPSGDSPSAGISLDEDGDLSVSRGERKELIVYHGLATTLDMVGLQVGMALHEWTCHFESCVPDANRYELIPYPH